MGRDRILIGRFGVPHGVRGALRLTSFTGVPGAIAAYKPLFDESGTRRFSIVSLRPIKHNIFVAKIAGVDDRASAKTLAHVKLFVFRATLPDVGDEEFYMADLIGLAATNEAGEAFGSVVNALNFAAAIFWKSPTQTAARQGFCPLGRRSFRESISRRAI